MHQNSGSAELLSANGRVREAMSDSEETAYISQEEAANVLSGQIEIYQHIQDQALSVVRMLLAFIGITVAGFSILITNFDYPSGLPVHNPDLIEAQYQRAIVYLAIMVVIAGSYHAADDIHDTLKGAIDLLSAPKLKPFSNESPNIVITEYSNMRGNSEYESWIEQNQEMVSDRNSDLAEVYQDLKKAAFTLSYVIPLALATYFLPQLLFLITPFLVATGTIWLLINNSSFMGFLKRIERHRFGNENVIWAILLVIFLIVAILMSFSYRYLPIKKFQSQRKANTGRLHRGPRLS